MAVKLASVSAKGSHMTVHVYVRAVQWKAARNIRKKLLCSVCIPCARHSLNLTGQAAVKCCSDAVFLCALVQIYFLLHVYEMLDGS